MNRYQVENIHITHNTYHLSFLGVFPNPDGIVYLGHDCCNINNEM